MSVADVGERWILGSAAIEDSRTAGVKTASGWGIEWARLVTFEHLVWFFFGNRFGNRRQQRLGVWVSGVSKKLFGGGDFYNFAQVHHRYPIGGVLDNAQVVSDEQEREVQFILEVHQEVHDLSLNGDIERADRLIGHDKSRIERQGAGDTDPLPLTAAELVGVPLAGRRVQTDQVQQFRCLLGPLVSGADAMNREGLADDRVDLHPGVQGALRILKDDLHFSAELSHHVAGQCQDILSFEADLALGGLDESQYASAGGGLARAGLSDESQGFPRADAEANAVNRPHLTDDFFQQPAPDWKMLDEVTYFEKHFVCRRAHGSRFSSFVGSEYW